MTLYQASNELKKQLGIYVREQGSFGITIGKNRFKFYCERGLFDPQKIEVMFDMTDYSFLSFEGDDPDTLIDYFIAEFEKKLNRWLEEDETMHSMGFRNIFHMTVYHLNLGTGFPLTYIRRGMSNVRKNFFECYQRRGREYKNVFYVNDADSIVDAALAYLLQLIKNDIFKFEAFPEKLRDMMTEWKINENISVSKWI